MNALASHDIASVSLDFYKIETYSLELEQGNVIGLMTRIPVIDPPEERVIDCSHYEPINLAQADRFSKDSEACLPLGRFVLLEYYYPITLTRQISGVDYCESEFTWYASVIDCKNFKSLFDARKFDRAIDWDMYTRWGPGAFIYDYDTGLNRKSHTHNGVDWIGYGTKYRAPADSKEFMANHTYYAVLNERYMLEFSLRVSGVVKGVARESVVSSIYLKFDSLHRELIEQVYVGDYTVAEMQKRRLEYPNHVVNTQPGPVCWLEEPVRDDIDIQRAMDELGIEFNEQLLFSPFDASEKEKLIGPPFALLHGNPVTKDMAAQCLKLIAQMKKTYASLNG